MRLALTHSTALVLLQWFEAATRVFYELSVLEQEIGSGGGFSLDPGSPVYKLVAAALLAVIGAEFWIYAAWQLILLWVYSFRDEEQRAQLIIQRHGDEVIQLTPSG